MLTSVSIQSIRVGNSTGGEQKAGKTLSAEECPTWAATMVGKQQWGRASSVVK